MLVFLVLNILRDTLVPFPGSKYRCRRISLGHTFSALLTLFKFPVSSTVCCRHPFQVQIRLSTTMQWLVTLPEVTVRGVA